MNGDTEASAYSSFNKQKPGWHKVLNVQESKNSSSSLGNIRDVYPIGWGFIFFLKVQGCNLRVLIDVVSLAPQNLPLSC